MTEQNLPPFLTCLLLNVAERKMLVPNTAVAELVPYRNVETIEHAPQWLIGQLEWRGLRLPVISYAVLSEQPAQVDEQSRIVIVNAMGARPDFRFYALVIQGIPRTLRVDAGLLEDTTSELGQYELQAVKQHGETHYIPDLQAIENLILDSGIIG